MKTATRLKGIGEYYFSKKLRAIDELNKQGKQVINLGIGSPDLPPHPEVINVLQEEAMRPDVHGYQSYKGSPVLRKAMSDWYKIGSQDRKSTRLNSSHLGISYAVFCLKKKK